MICMRISMRGFGGIHTFLTCVSLLLVVSGFRVTMGKEKKN